VIIVDDEPPARAVVREYLGAHAGVTIVAECGNGFDAVKAVTELAPDVMFLDVQMPKLDGFEVLELLGRSVPVIFTTAYDRYALDAFAVNSIDYLLKPIESERLERALDKLTRFAGQPHVSIVHGDILAHDPFDLVQPLPPGSPLSRLEPSRTPRPEAFLPDGESCRA
jgi:two-component system LytT family response regulator